MDLLREILTLKDREGSYIIGHQLNVYFYAGKLARLLNLELAKIVEVAALYHDMGKIGIADEILCKPEDLSVDEWRVVRTHPALGAEFIRKYVASRNGGGMLTSEEVEMVCAAIFCHHERWDGEGYPNGFKGEETPLAARIIAVADAYDAMTADRPYRKALPREEALRRIAEGAGRQFDPEVADAFVKMLTDKTT